MALKGTVCTVFAIRPQSSKCNKAQIISPILNSRFQLNAATYLPNYIKDHNQNNIICVCYLKHCLTSDYCPCSSCSFSLQCVANIRLTVPLNGKSPSGETNHSSVSQVDRRILLNPKVHYHVHNSLPSALQARSMQFMASHPISLTAIFILPSHQYLGLSNGLFLQVSQKTEYTFLFSPHISHSQPISLSLL